MIAVLAVPTLISHLLLGHIRWSLSAPFALGAVPGAVADARVTSRVGSESLRKASAAC